MSTLKPITKQAVQDAESLCETANHLSKAMLNLVDLGYLKEAQTVRTVFKAVIEELNKA